MNIRVADNTLGECNVTINSDISKREQYLIKSLCVLQIMCMNSEEDPEKHKEFVKIVKDATEKIEDLYCNEKKEEGGLCGTEDFEL